LRTVGLLFLAAAMDFAHAQSPPPPAWWLAPSTRIIDPNHTDPDPGNLSPANVGQLKHVAAMAAHHLQDGFPLTGVTGSQVQAMVGAFQPTDQDYAPITLGQLKAVAKPFYDHLLFLGYDTKANLIARGFPSSWAHNYPWNPATPPDENYQIATLGQLKVVFSFSINGLVDSDGNGLSDAWEVDHFGQIGVDPTADADGDGISNLEEFIFGTNPQVQDISETTAGATYVYDAANRLEQVGGNSALPEAINLDPEGNILTK
jgi:hypothetical protein